jgi:hypothetical protein
MKTILLSIRDAACIPAVRLIEDDTPAENEGDQVILQGGEEFRKGKNP